MHDVTFRQATSADIDRILEIVNAVPGEEAVALMGTEELALEYDEGLVRLDPIPSESRITVLAEDGEQVVGVLQYQFGDAPHHSRVEVFKLLLKVLGPGALRPPAAGDLVPHDRRHRHPDRRAAPHEPARRRGRARPERRHAVARVGRGRSARGSARGA